MNDNLRVQIDKTLEHARMELAGIRGGRAHPALVEDVRVKAYDSDMRIRDLASIAVPEPRVLQLTIWDESIIDAVEAALKESDLGTMPSVAGNVIRIALPPMTGERKAQLTKLVGNIREDARISLRQERDSALEAAKKQKDAGEISEDEFFRMKDDVEDAIKMGNDAIEEMRKNKETELDEMS